MTPEQISELAARLAIDGAAVTVEEALALLMERNAAVAALSRAADDLADGAVWLAEFDPTEGAIALAQDAGAARLAVTLAGRKT